jgi:capsular exopolysaccharide synthesis family protein
VPSYQASAKLLVYPAQGSGAPDFNAIQNSPSLVETYRQLITTRPVLNPVVRDLRLPFGVDELQGAVSATASRDALLLTVTASDPDPAQAARIANAVASSFTTVIRNQAAQLGQASRQALNQQVADTKRQIEAVSQQIEASDPSSLTATPVDQAQLDSLRSNLASLQQTYAQLLETSQQMDLNLEISKTQVSVFEQAAVPTVPDGPRATLSILLGMFTGLLIAGGLVALLEYLDTTVKPDTDVLTLAGAELLAVIGRAPWTRRGRARLFVLERPDTPAAESVRLLRTNLQFATEAGDVTSLAISSPGFGDGKSTVAANLAVSMAQAGLTTVLIDADLRHPSQHRIFQIRNDQGLTTLLTNRERPWPSVATEVVMPALRLIPSGPPPRQPADLLNSGDLRRLLAEIGQVADVILLDTSPIRAGSDALLVAANVDGVVLVCRAGRTRLAALRGAVTAFHHGTIRVLGVVLNRQPGRAMDSFFHRPGSSGSNAVANGSLAPRRAGTLPMVGNGHFGLRRRPARRRATIKARKQRPSDVNED